MDLREPTKSSGGVGHIGKRHSMSRSIPRIEKPLKLEEEEEEEEGSPREILLDKLIHFSSYQELTWNKQTTTIILGLRKLP